MALIIDPDLLADSAADDASEEVFIKTSDKTIKLVVVGNLSTDGVTLKCLYSFLKEEWRLDPNGKNLAAFPFPMVPVTDESFEFVDGWDFLNDTGRNLIRTAGWTVRNVSGNVTAKYAGIIGLGSVSGGNQLYYQQASGAASTNVVLTGQINQAVKILDDPNGDGGYGDGFDKRTYYKLFVREYQQTYDDANLADIGVSAMDSIAYRFPLSASSDALKITHDDTAVSTTSPYTEIKIRYFSAAFSRDVDSATNRSFGIVIDVGTHSGIDGSAPGGASVLTSAEGGMSVNAFAGGVLSIYEGTDENLTFPIVSNTATTITVTGTLAAGSDLSFSAQLATPVSATAEEIYEKVQWSLRQATDIDATTGTVTGKTADMLLRFVGDTLEAGTLSPVNPNGGGSGVLIQGFSASDTNRITFRDSGGTNRTYPFVAVLTINFGANLSGDTNAKYWVYFTTLPGGTDDFGEADAVIVNDNDGTPMTGNVSAQSSIQKTFNYDGNVQGGRSSGTNADVTIVAIGLATGQYVKTTATIARSTANVGSLTAALERNYANP